MGQSHTPHLLATLCMTCPTPQELSSWTMATTWTRTCAGPSILCSTRRYVYVDARLGVSGAAMTPRLASFLTMALCAPDTDRLRGSHPGLRLRVPPGGVANLQRAERVSYRTLLPSVLRRGHGHYVAIVPQ